jgi:type I restriction enzyme, R subunit
MEIEMLYEIISPDAFLHPFMDDYASLSAIYAVVQNAYSKRETEHPSPATAP